jgi:hypothetical protein
MAVLTADQILKVADAKTFEVEVPEWGGEVYIRVMSVGERDANELDWLSNKDKGVPNFRSKFLARVLSDKDGNRLFSDDQVKELKKKSGDVCDRLFKLAMRYNSVTEEDVEIAAGN